MLGLLIALAVALVLAFWVAATYNRLVRNRNLVREGWSGIDVQLKRRANLIPNLVETVKGYAGHEREVLEQVTALRGQAGQAGGVGERGRAEGLLGAALGRLFAVAENYPDLKANANFAQLQASLEEVEEQIQLARRYYNGAVRNLNILVESFPSNLVARNTGFSQAEFFELADEAARQVPEVSFG